MSNAIHAQIPDQLWQQAQTLVQQGWANSMEEVVNESLRRYLESHQDVLTEAFIQEDVEWGLHGRD
ncbi:MAG: CopG family transcriptional regulator [Gallionella sp.]|jgi:Arc/MetJ-type ribon-helix-helix transcriptional regulator